MTNAYECANIDNNIKEQPTIMPYASLETKKAYQRIYFQRNKKKLIASNRKYRDKNRATILAKQLETNRLHPEKTSEWHRKYKQNNRSKVIAWAEKRRATILGSKIGPINYKTLLAGGICGICQEPIIGKYHFDHIIPLSRGGAHTQDNLQLTHPKCNLAKGTKLMTEMV